MSQKQKYIFLILFFVIGIILTACQKDYTEDIQEENNVIDSPFSSWIVTATEYEQNQQLLGRLEALMPSKDDKQSLKENHYDAQNDITIHTEHAKYIEYADYNLHSYTFSIERGYDTGNILENLVFSYDSETGSYEAGLVTHHFSAEQREEFLSTQHVRSYYDVTYQSVDLALSDIIAENFHTPCVTHFNTYHITPDTGQTFLYSSTDGNIQNVCDHNMDCHSYTTILIDCSQVVGGGGSSSSGSSGTTDPSDDTSSGGGGNNNNGGNPNDPTDPNDPNVVTTPYIDLNEQNALNELKAISETPIIKARLDDYRIRVSTDVLERGSEFRTHADDTYYEHQISQDSLSFSGTRFPSPLVNSKVRVHLHHDNTNVAGEALAPVPSAEDVFGMADFFTQKENLNADDSNEIVSIVVSRRDLYAFKIRSTTKVEKFKQDLEKVFIIDGKPKKYKNLLKEAYVKDVKNKVVDYCQSQGGCLPELEEAVWEGYFLNFLKRLDSGLSFYQAFYNPGTDTYDWELLN